MPRAVASPIAGSASMASIFPARSSRRSFIMYALIEVFPTPPLPHTADTFGRFLLLSAIGSLFFHRLPHGFKRVNLAADVGIIAGVAIEGKLLRHLIHGGDETRRTLADGPQRADVRRR